MRVPLFLVFVVGAISVSPVEAIVVQTPTTALTTVQPGEYLLASPRPATATFATAQEGPQTGPIGFAQRADATMGRVNSWIAAVFFFDVIFWDAGNTLPLVVAWLVIAAIYLTLRMGFVNLWAFRHAVNVTRGKYTDPDEPGDVSHFEALSTALSATVGLGNIAGVAIAVSLGGPGATFWMIVAGLLGMSTKFTECTLGQAYREMDREGRVLGGPMQYLAKGLAERGKPNLGRILAVAFAILCIGGSLGGGNAFQVNQSMNTLQQTIPALEGNGWVYGLFMTFLVGIVIIGGIRRIANVADKIVPTMALVYVTGALIVVLANLSQTPAALASIVSGAFTPDAAFGGFVGVLVIGFQRASFSNEAGAGSAAIAHSAARTEYPVREGVVALLEPFIDTVVICTMTALVIVFSGAYNNPAYADLISTSQGAALTSRAFGEHLAFFPYVLSFAVLLFAYSTMISWSYYGERCAVWLLGPAASLPYKVLFLTFVFLGSIITSVNILNFGDLMILGMAFPNLLGIYFLSGKVRKLLDGYWGKYKAGEFPEYDVHVGLKGW